MNSTLAAVALAALAAGGVAYVFIYTLLSGEARAEKRQKALVGRGPERRTERVAAVNRRDQVAQSLKDLEAKEKARHKRRAQRDVPRLSDQEDCGRDNEAENGTDDQELPIRPGKPRLLQPRRKRRMLARTLARFNLLQCLFNLVPA